HDRAQVALAQDVPTDLDDAPCRQADDGVPAPGLPALDRLEKVGVWPVGELEVDRQGRIQVGVHLADQRDAVVALGRQGGEFSAAEHCGGVGGKGGDYGRCAAPVATSMARPGCTAPRATRRDTGPWPFPWGIAGRTA